MYAWGQQYFVSVKLVLHTKYGSFVEDHSASVEDNSSLETNSCVLQYCISFIKSKPRYPIGETYVMSHVT